MRAKIIDDLSIVLSPKRNPRTIQVAQSLHQKVIGVMQPGHMLLYEIIKPYSKSANSRGILQHALDTNFDLPPIDLAYPSPERDRSSIVASSRARSQNENSNSRHNPHPILLRVIRNVSGPQEVSGHQSGQQRSQGCLEKGPGSDRARFVSLNTFYEFLCHYHWLRRL